MILSEMRELGAATALEHDALVPQINALSPRLVLERDPAVYISIVEDAYVDSTLNYGYLPAALKNETLARLVVRGINRAPALQTQSETLGEEFLLKAPLPPIKTRSRAADGAKANSDDAIISVTSHDGKPARDTNYVRNSAVILLKLRRSDLDKIIPKDETQPILLLDAHLERIDGKIQNCPLRLYYLPKWPEDWTANRLDFESIKNASKYARGSRFFFPLVTAGSLIFFDLGLIDDAFIKATFHLRKPRARPTNVTLALFYDDTDTTRPKDASSSCHFRSSRAPGLVKPKFELVKYRQPTS